LISAFKSDFVTVHVGQDKQKYTPHKDILTRVKFFAACLDSGFRESKENEILLPEEEPEVFERILEYLYHDRIDAVRMDTYDSEYVMLEDQIAVFMAKVWLAADKYCMEECQNHVMDYFLGYLSIRWPSPKILSEISKRGMRDCLLRKLIMEDLAACLLSQGSDWENATENDCNIMKLVDAGGIDAQDFFKICLAWAAAGRTGRSTDEHCKWHIHNTTDKCPLPADEDGWLGTTTPRYSPEEQW
jgi:hypothetical protein